MKVLARRVLTSVRSATSVPISRQLSSLANPDATPAPTGPVNNKLFVAGNVPLYCFLFWDIWIPDFDWFRVNWICIDLVVIFGTGLSWAADEKTLKDAFSAFGDVTEGEVVCRRWILSLIWIWISACEMFDEMPLWVLILSQCTWKK